MNAFDEFYPVSDTMTRCPSGMWQLALTMTIAGHRAAAAAGDRERESRLINRIGQLRRSGPPFNQLTGALQEEVKASCIWLRSQGRTVNLAGSVPARWITARDGVTPRW